MTEHAPKQTKPAATPQRASHTSETEDIVSIEQALTDPAQLIRLQRMIGNQAVNRLISRKANTTGMPDTLKSGVESLSGLSMDDVQVHYNSPEPAKLHALAYSQGGDIHLQPGAEKHLPHEAWHVIQQKQGRVSPTVRLQGTHINTDATLEAEADTMGVKAAQTPASPDSPHEVSAPAETAQMLFEDPTLWIGLVVAGVTITATVVGYMVGMCGGDKKAAAAQLVKVVGEPDTNNSSTDGDDSVKKKKKKKKKSTSTGDSEETSDTTKAEDSDEIGDDELAFAQSLMKVSGKKEKAAPVKATVAATPFVPLTPQQEWANKQRELGNDCDMVIPQLNANSRTPAAFGDHDVSQASVTGRLPAIGRGNIWLQGRPNNSSSEVRVYVECTAGRVPVQGGAVVISDGLSHQAKRNAGTYWAYLRTGGSTFNHHGGAKHSKDPTP